MIDESLAGWLHAIELTPGSERQGAIEDGCELNALVAPHTWVGSAPSGVLSDEVVDDVLAEALGYVPDVERDPEDVGRPSRVTRVLERATTPRALAVGGRTRREREMYAGHVVTRVYRAGSRDRGVDSAGHCGEHLHDDASAAAGGGGGTSAATAAALRARSTAGPIASVNARTSPSVEV